MVKNIIIGILVMTNLITIYLYSYDKKVESEIRNDDNKTTSGNDAEANNSIINVNNAGFEDRISDLEDKVRLKESEIIDLQIEIRNQKQQKTTLSELNRLLENENIKLKNKIDKIEKGGEGTR